MELWLYVQTLNDLENFDKLMDISPKDRLKIDDWIKNYSVNDNNKLSPQYATFLKSLTTIREVYGDQPWHKVKGFYYGFDNCEYLIPSVKEIEAVWNKVNELNKTKNFGQNRYFSFILPYTGPFGVAKATEAITYLASLNKPIEVICNDIGMMYMIKKDFANSKLIAVAGRHLNKAQRNPMILDEADPIVPPGSDKEFYNNIKKNQTEYYASNEYTIPFFLKKMQHLGAKRFGFDYTGAGLKKEVNDMNIDIYFPYSVTASGRNCMTAGFFEKKRAYYPLDTPCKKFCQLIDTFIEDGKADPDLLQRGNAVYRINKSGISNINKQILDNPDNRLVWQMFVY